MHNAAIRISLATVAALAAFAAFAASASASSVSLNNGEVAITGEDDSDVITLSTDGTTITVVDTGAGGATDDDITNCNQVNPQTVTCAVNPPAGEAITSFDVELGDGTDSFTNQNMVTENGRVDAFGDTGSKTIVGGPGNQFLQGGLADDSISGGDGNDFLEDGGQGLGATPPTGGNDILDGGPGDDTAEYFRLGTDPLSLTLDNAANDGAAGETDNLLALENIFSSSGNDTIIGDASSNQIDGGFGNDLIAGQGGNDTLVGERSRLALARGIIQGGPTNDTLIGGTGRDALRCADGDDVAIRDPRDEVDVTCERIGADVTANSAPVTGKKGNKVKIGLACPETEGAACQGTVEIYSNGKRIGKGNFNVGAGKSKNAKAKLTKKGRKALKNAGGSLLVSVSAFTTEPGGVSESAGQVLIFR